MIKIDNENQTVTVDPPHKAKGAALPVESVAAVIYKGDKGDKGDSVKGDKGDPGLTGKQGLIGPRGPEGKEGRGIESITQPDEGIAQINYTDGTHDTIELPRGEDGREIELGYSRTHLQWRYVGEAEWKNLFPIPEMWQQGEGAGTLKIINSLNGLIGNVTLSAGSNVTITTVGNNIQISSSGSGGGAVDSVNGQTGVVVLDTGDIAEVVNKNYVTDADIVNLGNLSGVNTGDQDLSGFLKLDQTTPQSVINGAPIFVGGLKVPTGGIVTLGEDQGSGRLDIWALDNPFNFIGGDSELSIQLDGVELLMLSAGHIYARRPIVLESQNATTEAPALTAGSLMSGINISTQETGQESVQIIVDQGVYIDCGQSTNIQSYRSWDWYIGGNLEMSLAGNTLTFNNGANDTSLGWGIDNRLDINAATIRPVGILELQKGSTTSQPMKFQVGGSLLTTTQAVTVETNDTDIFWTATASGVRQKMNMGAFLATNNARFSPADSTNYFLGGLGNSVAFTVATPANRTYIPRGGTVRAVYILVINTGTLGSAETSTFNFRLNDTTDTVVSSAITTNAATAQFNNTGLSIAVAAGDFFEWKWTSPAYATNPTNVQFFVWVYIN